MILCPGLSIPTQGAQSLLLLGELRFHKSFVMEVKGIKTNTQKAKKKKKKKSDTKNETQTNGKSKIRQIERQTKEHIHTYTNETKIDQRKQCTRE